jgi:hypothetical protein
MKLAFIFVTLPVFIPLILLVMIGSVAEDMLTWFQATADKLS